MASRLETTRVASAPWQRFFNSCVLNWLIGVSPGLEFELFGTTGWDLLRIATDHLHDIRSQFEQLTLRVLEAATAIIASRDHDLVAGATRILRAPRISRAISNSNASSSRR
jgi:hypothetical protein